MSTTIDNDNTSKSLPTFLGTSNSEIPASLANLERSIIPAFDEMSDPYLIHFDDKSPPTITYNGSTFNPTMAIATANENPDHYDDENISCQTTFLEPIVNSNDTRYKAYSIPETYFHPKADFSENGPSEFKMMYRDKSDEDSEATDIRAHKKLVTLGETVDDAKSKKITFWQAGHIGENYAVQHYKNHGEWENRVGSVTMFQLEIESEA
ncbi:uncharacterized protein L201_000444 [Kwoniella dendrophila CBS 6074]|uniref:Uncharacterized protein n=1 Tax=Kwoniella dendrophila CBS 6074 TaxID=1295534 RepID=A0AAX4JLZ8_9TREE